MAPEIACFDVSVERPSWCMHTCAGHGMCISQSRRLIYMQLPWTCHRYHPFTQIFVLFIGDGCSLYGGDNSACDAKLHGVLFALELYTLSIRYSVMHRCSEISQWKLRSRPINATGTLRLTGGCSSCNLGWCGSSHLCNYHAITTIIVCSLCPLPCFWNRITNNLN